MERVQRINTYDMNIETLYWDPDRECYVLGRTNINGYTVPETRFYPDEGRGVVQGFSSVDFSDIFLPRDWGRLRSSGSASRSEKNRIMRKRLEMMVQEVR